MFFWCASIVPPPPSISFASPLPDARLPLSPRWPEELRGVRAETIS